MNPDFKITPKKVFTTALILLLGINLILVPYLYRKKTTAVLQKVLSFWEAGDPASAMAYFEHPNQSPPIFSVNSYKIVKRKFGGKKGRRHAEFHVILNFPKENLLPSGVIWICEIDQTQSGWHITSFTLSSEPQP
ncbi:MAG: hypothetical protein A2Z88_06760 [Omnitrophica WOR_2 bacterium GWA2_47_8]|nr:MAG: hypothetical protein A2Z88_06760 [Omnitrophica WOR_2 bacterium GWA2_47_8]